ncbi:MAG TPA: hypothetical protein VGM30_14430 [Puia sp.]|jgi:hypothetical protein
MKKIFILSACLAVISFSCKKSSSSSGPSNYITASIDGTAKTFNAGIMAFKTTQNGQTVFNVIGFSDGSANPESFSITIGNSPTTAKPIVAGTYTEVFNPDFITVGEYIPGSTTYVYASGLAAPPVNIFTVTITSIDNNSVKGTFSGDVEYLDVATAIPGSTKKTITNGSFYAKLSM